MAQIVLVASLIVFSLCELLAIVFLECADARSRRLGGSPPRAWIWWNDMGWIGFWRYIRAQNKPLQDGKLSRLFVAFIVAHAIGVLAFLVLMGALFKLPA